MYISKCRLRNGDNFLSDSMCSGICDQDRCGGREPTMTSSYAYCFTYHLNPLVHVRLPGTTNIEILWFHNVVRPKKLLHEQSNCRTLRGHHCHLVVSLLTWSSYNHGLNAVWIWVQLKLGWIDIRRWLGATIFQLPQLLQGSWVPDIYATQCGNNHMWVHAVYCYSMWRSGAISLHNGTTEGLYLWYQKCNIRSS